jgi:hypothetical protein
LNMLSADLLAAQRSGARSPYFAVEARNNLSGVVNLKWSRLYNGLEADSTHAITIAGDGSLIRVRATPASDNCRLYFQRVTAPGPGSDFSRWTYLDQYNVQWVAACSLGAEVSLVWVRGTGEISRRVSLNNGATWQSPEYVGFALSGAVNGLAASYKPGGDMTVFFTHYRTLFTFKRTSGVWQGPGQWNKSTFGLGNVASIYDGDWKLLLAGQDLDADYKVWSLIYGDGGEAPAGAWSDLKSLTSAPEDSGYTYDGLFLDKPDTVYRSFFVEKYSGSESYNRPYFTHTLPGTGFAASLWHEPVPFNLESQNGPAMAHSAGWAWLAVPGGVWRASLVRESQDLSHDILSARVDLTRDSESLALELNNDRSQYANTGWTTGPLLDTGCQIDIRLGYATGQGVETGAGHSFTLEACEHKRAAGKSTLLLYATGGWEALGKWVARCQLRWNGPDEDGDPVQEAPVREIAAQVLARAGIKLVNISCSEAGGGFYPDFTIHAGDNGRSVLSRLLSFVPDLLFLEGLTGYWIDPQPADQAVYTYNAGEQPPGTTGWHAILEGSYIKQAAGFNRFLVEGLDPAVPNGSSLAAESFDWQEVSKSGDRLEMMEDLNITSVALARERGEAWVRREFMDSFSGSIKVPVNCGQQMYDVISITDPGAGLYNAKRRILGITLFYLPQKGEYAQVLKLGGA